ncbi:hypothetical protein N9Z22_00280 [bacterium]|nr:hypothetical protein [bacterium]
MKAIAAGFLDGRFDVSGTSLGGSHLGHLIQRELNRYHFTSRQNSTLTKRDELLSFALRYRRMPVIQLLVLRNRRQWLLTAILRSGYAKKFSYLDSVVLGLVGLN